MAWELLGTASLSITLYQYKSVVLTEGWLSHKGHLRPSENTDIYISIHNSSKTTVMKYQRK